MPTPAEELTRLYAAQIGSRVRPRDTQQRWTRATKEILVAFAGSCGWNPICTCVRNHEFLLDFIAIHPETSDVKFAVETQWGPVGAVIPDFQKLLYIKSECKILICGSGGDRIRSRLEEVASRYSRHLIGETYIILDVSEPDLAIRSYVWTAPADGPAQVRFSPLIGKISFTFVASVAS